MKTIPLTRFAEILDIEYHIVYYQCTHKHICGLFKKRNKYYYYVERAKIIAEKLIIYSSKKIEQVLQELDEY